MNSQERGLSQFVYRYAECECSTDLLPAVVDPSLRSLFALSAAALADVIEIQPNDPEVYKINMPPLWASNQRGEPARALGNREERRIIKRAQQMVNAPYLHENPAEIDDRGLLHIQAWLEGLALGETELRIAEHLGASHKHIAMAGKWLRGRLGAENQPNAMYGALLHGCLSEVPAAPAQHVPVSHYERLHFYLTSLGFTAKQAAKLTRPDSGEWYADTISSVRAKIIRDYDASFSAQAIFYAFKTGYYKRLPNRTP